MAVNLVPVHYFGPQLYPTGFFSNRPSPWSVACPPVFKYLRDRSLLFSGLQVIKVKKCYGWNLEKNLDPGIKGIGEKDLSFEHGDLCGGGVPSPF